MASPHLNQYLPHIAYDSVVFGFSGEKLKILIMEYHNTGWFALPGGFVKIDEPLDEAVKRGLKERTGLDEIYLEQFHTFGSLERANRGTLLIDEVSEIPFETQANILRVLIDQKFKKTSHA